MTSVYIIMTSVWGESPWWRDVQASSSASWCPHEQLCHEHHGSDLCVTFVWTIESYGVPGL